MGFPFAVGASTVTCSSSVSLSLIESNLLVGGIVVAALRSSIFTKLVLNFLNFWVSGSLLYSSCCLIRLHHGFHCLSILEVMHFSSLAVGFCVRESNRLHRRW